VNDTAVLDIALEAIDTYVSDPTPQHRAEAREALRRAVVRLVRAHAPDPEVYQS